MELMPTKRSTHDSDVDRYWQGALSSMRRSDFGFSASRAVVRHRPKVVMRIQRFMSALAERCFGASRKAAAYRPEQDLREARHQDGLLGGILERAFQPFGVGYPDGQLGLVNRAFEQLTGYTGEELRALDWTATLTPPEWREIERQKLQELDLTGQPVRYEKEYIRKDGSRVPIELLVHLVRDPKGKPEYYYSFLTDITERKRAEEALRESERQFRTLADSIPNLAWRANSDGYITWYNRRWYEYTGTTPQQMEGWGWQSVHDPQTLPEVLERWKASIATGEPFDMTFPLRGADGRFRPFLTRVTPLKDAQGRVQQWFGANTDVSEQQQAEAAMRDLNARLRKHVAQLQAANEEIQASRRAAVGLAEDALQARQEAERVSADLQKSNEALSLSRRAALNLMEDAVRARKQAEQASATLRESEGRLELFIEHAPASLAMLDRQMRYLSVSRRWLSDFHLGNRDLRGLSHYAVFPDIPDAWKAVHRRALAGEVVKAEADRFDRADGSVQWLRWEVRPWHNAAGEIAGIIIFSEDITERKRAEEELRASRALLDDMIESMPAFAYAKDRDGRFTMVNAALSRLAGRPRETMLECTDYDLYPKADADGMRAMDLRVMTEETPIQYEETLNVEGVVRTCLTAKFPIRDPQGNITGLGGVTTDITERKRREDDLRRLNRVLRALKDSGQAMLRADDEWKYLNDVCKIIVEDCGHALVWIGFAEQDEARTVRPVAQAGFETGYLQSLNITWADTERGRGPTGTAIRTGKPVGCVNMLTDPAFAPWRGEALKRGYASSLVLPLLTDGKAFGAITVYARQADGFSAEETQLLVQLADDVAYCITSLRVRAAKAEAERQLQLLSTAVESAVNGIAVTDRDARILWVNPAFTRLTGYTQAEALGQNPRVLKSGEHPPEFYREMWATLLRGDAWHGELVNRRKDGSVYHEEMTITPVRAGGAEITHFVAIKQDITERKRAQAELQRTAQDLDRSNRDLEQFAYIASHDLQEPLRAVGGYVSLLQRRFPKHLDAKALEYIHGASEGAHRMARLITDLLAFSRVGTRGGSFAPADLNAVLNEALHNLHATIHTTGAKVTWDALPTLPVDATQMMQLFQNLIGNAIKFQGEQPPQIHVGARREDQRWVIFVRDNGIGIDPRYFEQIFQIFQRLHTRNVYAGSGIGLAICKKIVERHGGAIWVESQPGQGSTFFFSLPDPAAR
jgi:PAS domain S-box-containing protein